MIFCGVLVWTVGWVFVCMRSVDGCVVFFFQAEDGIRDLVRSRGLGDVYKRQGHTDGVPDALLQQDRQGGGRGDGALGAHAGLGQALSLIHI